ncbi:MAG: hypothetical protein JWP08_202 [Bryobacterales bacterium]|nr:hypothetical protein [Bryobacterales bacterium]
MRSFFLLLLYSGSVALSLASSVPEKLEVQDAPEISIDPDKDGNSVLVTLTNQSGKSSAVYMRAGKLTTRAGIPVHEPVVTIALPGDTGSKTDLYKRDQELAPGESLTVEVEVTGLPANGSYTVPLFNGPKLCGKLAVTGFPFRVRINGPANGTTEVVLGQGENSFTLKNDDPLQYRVAWSLSVDGRTVAGETPLGPFATEDVTVTNANCGGGKGTGLPVCLDGVQDFWAKFSSLLRDSKQDGKLTIAYQPPSSETVNATLIPHTSIPVKVITRLRTTELTSLYGSCILFVMLTLGAALSVLTNLWIPHSLRKNDICTRLMLLIRSIREISESIPSQARISAEVEAKEIRDRLRNAGWFYSNFDTVLRYYEAQTAALETRVELLRKADEYHQELEQLTDISVPPTYLTRARLAFEPAMEVFAGAEWSACQQDLATRLVQEFKEQVEALRRMRESGVAEDQFTAILRARFERLKALLGTSTGETVGRFQKMFPRVFKRLEKEKLDEGPGSQDWAQIDYDLWKLGLMQRFARSYDSATSASRRTSLENKAGFPDGAAPGSLLYYLQLNTWDALRCAELLCDEISQGIFPEDICNAIQQTPPRVAIKIRQKEIMACGRVDCELCFVNYSLNTATARREISPKWTFSAGPVVDLPSTDRGFGGGVQALGFGLRRILTTLYWRTALSPKTERGWVVSCLVPNVDRIQVTVSFEDWFGEMRVGSNQAALQASFPIVPRDTGLRAARRWLETSRSVVALAIPVVGLLAGAREKLLNLDVSTALLAVFALGFSTDSIKSALLRGTGTVSRGAADSDAGRATKAAVEAIAPVRSSPGMSAAAVAALNR